VVARHDVVATVCGSSLGRHLVTTTALSSAR
jgi:hypothetical protein